MSQPVIAVDLGGTNLRTALFLEDSPQPVKVEKVPTLADEGLQAVTGRILQAIKTVQPENRDGLRIGIAAPGFIDSGKGILFGSPNLPGWVDVPLKKLIRDEFGVPVELGNDANLAGLGEWRHGAGRGSDDLLYLTISTGIGGGVITGGTLLLGSSGLGAELGHLTIEPGGPICGCGQPGHIEAVAAGPAIARNARVLIEAGEASSLSTLIADKGELTARDVGRAANEGDSLARRVVEEAATKIGLHLAGLLHTFNPEVIVLGGGVTQMGAVLLEPLEESLRSSAMNPMYLEGLRLETAQLGDDAGLVGAMVLARGF